MGYDFLIFRQFFPWPWVYTTEIYSQSDIFKPLVWVQLYLKMTYSNRKKSMISLHEPLSPKKFNNVCLFCLHVCCHCVAKTSAKQLGHILIKISQKWYLRQIDAWKAFFLTFQKSTPVLDEHFHNIFVLDQNFSNFSNARTCQHILRNGINLLPQSTFQCLLNFRKLRCGLHFKIEVGGAHYYTNTI